MLELGSQHHDDGHRGVRIIAAHCCLLQADDGTGMRPLQGAEGSMSRAAAPRARPEATGSAHWHSCRRLEQAAQPGRASRRHFVDV